MAVARERRRREVERRERGRVEKGKEWGAARVRNDAIVTETRLHEVCLERQRQDLVVEEGKKDKRQINFELFDTFCDCLDCIIGRSSGR